MIGRLKRLTVLGSCLAVALTGCSFQGINSLPLPGAVGRGPDSVTYHVELPNVATMEPNSPVMIDDVVVGSVGKMTVKDWHADVEISVKPDVVVPANAVATVGQTSLLGSMHLALNPPLGEEPRGRLEPGATIPLSDASTYPTTEQTLSSLSTVVNAGGLGQMSDVIHNLSAAVSGRETEIRELLTRLDNFVGVLDAQRDDIIASIQQLNRVAGTFANQRGVLDRALKELPPAIDVLIKERPTLTTALEKLGQFGDTAATLVNDAGDDLVKDLEHLGPALGKIADIGPDLNLAVLWLTAFPYGPTFADRITRGDYINLFATFDLTYPRLKKTLLLGTRWGDMNAKMIPAPGDPYWQNYSYSPMDFPMTPPPELEAAGVKPEKWPPVIEGLPQPPVAGPVLPVAPPPPAAPWLPTGQVTQTGQIFAGPYGPESAPGTPPADAPSTPGGGG